MLEIIAKIGEYGEPVAIFIGWAVVAVTAFMKMPFMKLDPTKYGPFIKGVLQALQWLPTLGINPMTAEVEKALADLEAKVPAK